MKEAIRKAVFLATLAIILIFGFFGLLSAYFGWWLVLIPVAVGVVALIFVGVDALIWAWQTLWGIINARFVGLFAHLFVHRPKTSKNFSSIEDELKIL